MSFPSSSGSSPRVPRLLVDGLGTGFGSVSGSLSFGGIVIVGRKGVTRIRLECWQLATDSAKVVALQETNVSMVDYVIAIILV